jgi:hypothetical protein
MNSSGREGPWDAGTCLACASRAPDQRRWPAAEFHVPSALRARDKPAGQPGIGFPIGYPQAIGGILLVGNVRRLTWNERRRSMKRFLWVLGLLAASAMPSSADCPDGELYVHHDFSFEWAPEHTYCWQFGGVQAPYYGAFGEAYDLGSGTVACGSYWVCTMGYYVDTRYDVYVWDGGVSNEPCGVLAVVPNVIPPDHRYCPDDFGQNDYYIGIDVSGDFTVGMWMDWTHHVCNYMIGADRDGPGGHPWTCIAPGLEWPSGWQDPSIVWGPTQSMGIGVYFTPRDPSGVDESDDPRQPPESPTWGSIKTLFR